MMGFSLTRSRNRVAATALALALGGCANEQTRPSSQPALPVSPVRSAAAQIFDRWCGDCHGPMGPGSMALERKYGGKRPAVLQERSDLRPDYVKLVVRRGMSFMPSFRKTEISDAELTLLAAYLAPSQERAP